MGQNSGHYTGPYTFSQVPKDVCVFLCDTHDVQFLFLDRSVANMGAGLDLILISSFGFYSLIFHRWSVLFRDQIKRTPNCHQGVDERFLLSWDLVTHITERRRSYRDSSVFEGCDAAVGRVKTACLCAKVKHLVCEYQCDKWEERGPGWMTLRVSVAARQLKHLPTHTHTHASLSSSG